MPKRQLTYSWTLRCDPDTNEALHTRRLPRRRSFATPRSARRPVKSCRHRCPNIHRKQRIRPPSLGNNKDKALFWFIAMRFLISLGRVFQPVSCSASRWLTSSGGAGLLSIGILSCLASAQRTVRFAKSLAHELEAQLIVLHAVLPLVMRLPTTRGSARSPCESTLAAAGGVDGGVCATTRMHR